MRVAVITTERRLPVKLVLKTNQLPPNLVSIPPIFWIGEESNDSVQADLLKERSLLHRGQHLNLLRGLQVGEFIDNRAQLLSFRAKFIEPLRVNSLFVLLESCEHAIDEVNDSSFSRTGRSVCWKDWCGD